MEPVFNIPIKQSIGNHGIDLTGLNKSNLDNLIIDFNNFAYFRGGGRNMGKIKAEVGHEVKENFINFWSPALYHALCQSLYPTGNQSSDVF
jgi:hypothetical protein